jgi:hypothetical protein
LIMHSNHSSSTGPTAAQLKMCLLYRRTAAPNDAVARAPTTSHNRRLPTTEEQPAAAVKIGSLDESDAHADVDSEPAVVGTNISIDSDSSDEEDQDTSNTIEVATVHTDASPSTSKSSTSSTSSTSSIISISIDADSSDSEDDGALADTTTTVTAAVAAHAASGAAFPPLDGKEETVTLTLCRAGSKSPKPVAFTGDWFAKPTGGSKKKDLFGGIKKPVDVRKLTRGRTTVCGACMFGRVWLRMLLDPTRICLTLSLNTWGLIPHTSRLTINYLTHQLDTLLCRHNAAGTTRAWPTRLQKQLGRR